MEPKKRSIIVEGPDSSGKSTLATKLGEHYGLYTFRAGPKPVDRQHAEVCMIYQCAWMHNTSCVWDRFTGISNVCNMPALHEDDLPMHAWYVKQVMQDAVIVICVEQDLDLHRRAVYETEQDEEIMRQQNNQVVANYARMAHDLPGVIRYNMKLTPWDTLIEEIDHVFAPRIP